MNDDNLTPPQVEQLVGWRQHKFIAMVCITIAISMALVGLSLWLYNSSGAAQLDLSRSDYEGVRDKTIKVDDFTGFSSSGDIDRETIEEFRELYDEQLEAATLVDSFGGDVLSDKALGID